MKNLVFAACLLSATMASAMPTVTQIESSQDVGTRAVTVNYTISDEPAVVTLSVQTNRGDGTYCDIGDANINHAVGDVNVRVGIGAHSITWHPDLSWPDHVFHSDMVRIGVKAWATNAPPDYMVVSLQIPSNVTYYTSAEAVPGGVGDLRYKTTHLLMRKIPARGVIWQMGSPTDEDASREADYETLRNVTLTEDYYMGVYELTQKQFALINGSYWTCGYAGDDKDVHPQSRMGRDAFRGAGATYRWPQDGHAVDPGKRVAKLRKLTGIQFDLPTSAQWEYACRAGKSGKWATASGTLGAAGWYLNNGGSKTHEVGLMEPNAWGLYDVHGNVGEITLDVYAAIASAGGATVTDPTGPDEPGSKHVVRGGSYAEQPYECRAARQRGLDEGGNNSFKDFIGFRLWAPAVQPY